MPGWPGSLPSGTDVELGSRHLVIEEAVGVPPERRMGSGRRAGQAVAEPFRFTARQHVLSGQVTRVTRKT